MAFQEERADQHATQGSPQHDGAELRPHGQGAIQPRRQNHDGSADQRQTQVF